MAVSFEGRNCVVEGTVKGDSSSPAGGHEAERHRVVWEREMHPSRYYSQGSTSNWASPPDITGSHESTAEYSSQGCYHLPNTWDVRRRIPQIETTMLSFQFLYSPICLGNVLLSNFISGDHHRMYLHKQGQPLGMASFFFFYVKDKKTEKSKANKQTKKTNKSKMIMTTTIATKTMAV